MTTSKSPDALVTVPSNEQFLDLPDEIAEKVDLFEAASMSPRTRKAYGSAWRTFLTWCEDHQADPRNPEVVVGFLAEQAEVKKLATLEVYLAAISQGLLGLSSLTQHARVRRVMKGIRRTLGPVGQDRKAPITVAQLHKFSAALPDTVKA